MPHLSSSHCSPHCQALVVKEKKVFQEAVINITLTKPILGQISSKLFCVKKQEACAKHSNGILEYRIILVYVLPKRARGYLKKLFETQAELATFLTERHLCWKE